MGCWNRSWSEAALGRQEARQSVSKTERKHVHLPNISARAAALGAAEPRRGPRAPSAAMGTGLGRRQEINLPVAGENHRTPVPPRSLLGWCLGARGLLIQSTCRGSPGVGRRQPGAPFLSPNTGDIRQLPRQLWVASAAFLSASGGRELQVSVRSGRDDPDRRSRGGTSTTGLFAWKSPRGRELCCVRLFWMGKTEGTSAFAVFIFGSRNCSCFPFTRWGWLFSYFLLHNVVRFGLHKRPQSRCCSLHGFGICSRE